MSKLFSLKPISRRMTRRQEGHDYRLPGRYMITLSCCHPRPQLSMLGGTPRKPELQLTELGERIAQMIVTFPEYHRELTVPAYVIMPDHVHFLVDVKKTMNRDLGCYIGALKGACSRQWSECEGRDNVIPLFEDGFHDRIIRDDRQYETVTNYIADNPRRLLIKRLRPELFHTYNHLNIGNREMAAYGNIFLLRDFQKMQVRIHRAWSSEDLDDHRRKALDCIAAGGVLVSPFIHQWEKEIRNEAIEAGGRIITLRSDGFEDRFKPWGRDFELCQEGRLLLLAPWPENNDDILTRSTALSLNDIAAELAASDYSDSLSLK